jgi:hypothetical protein
VVRVHKDLLASTEGRMICMVIAEQSAARNSRRAGQLTGL